MKLNQVTLPVSDLKAAVSFYRVLGFNLIVDTEHYARFECPVGDSTFSLSLHLSAESYSTIYFEEEDVDSWVDRLLEKGVVFDELPTDKPYLWREARLRDPSGNKIILYWAGENRRNPPWRVGGPR